MSARKRTAATIGDLRQPLWFEVAVPMPGTDQRAVLWTGPLTVEGVKAGMVALERFTLQTQLDVLLRELKSKQQTARKP